MIDSCDDTCPQDNILEFDKDEQAWYEIGKMKKRRSYLRDRFIKNKSWGLLKLFLVSPFALSFALLHFKRTFPF